MSQTFRITSGKIVASDPCYEIPTWCQGIVPARNGEWLVNVEYDEATERVKSISAYCMDASNDEPHLLDRVYQAGFLPFSFGVDSGQFGYFDEASYRNNDAITPEIPTWSQITNFDEAGEKFYSACCEQTLGDDAYGVFPFGIVSSSGWGDGTYPTRGIMDKDGNYIALSTTFIEDSNFDEDEDDNDDDFQDDEFPEE